MGLKLIQLELYWLGSLNYQKTPPIKKKKRNLKKAKAEGLPKVVNQKVQAKDQVARVRRLIRIASLIRLGAKRAILRMFQLLREAGLSQDQNSELIFNLKPIL